MANLAEIHLRVASPAISSANAKISSDNTSSDNTDERWDGPSVEVTTDHPLIACMASQYAGWQIKSDDYFAMGSGPMRALRGKESVLDSLALTESESVAVGVMETDELPGSTVCELVAKECNVEPAQLILCVAPTRSLAGTIQIVARSVETCLHKLFEQKFDLRTIVSGVGCAPLPPTALDFATGIGRTNDAMLYGGQVTLWVDCDDDSIRTIGPNIPSCSSRDWGRPFANVFKDYQFDFYQVDPGLFSPATVTFNNLATGNSFAYGQLRPDILRASFGTQFTPPK